MLSAKGVKEFFVGAENAEESLTMFKSAALTKRKISNTATSIDLFVPKYDTTQGAGRETLFHIIVITDRSAFKSAKHTADDVVQFSVARKYADFETLQERLGVEFSAVVFPPLPQRRLYCTEDDLEDRMVAFDSMMRVIAKTKRLSHSRSVLRFLGLPDDVIDRALEDMSAASSSGKSAKEPESPPEEEPEVDIFADDETEKCAEPQETSPAMSFSGDLPDVSVHTSLKTSSVEVQVDSYLLAAGSGAPADMKGVFSDQKTADRTKELTDTGGDLFDLGDDLDSLDHLTKPVKSSKPKSKAKAKARNLDESDGTLTEQQFAALDLQQYIASNAAAAASDEVDLFS